MVHTEFSLASEKATIRAHELAEELRGAPPPRQEAQRAPCRPSKYIESLTQRNGFQRRHVTKCAHATRRVVATTTAPPPWSRAAPSHLGRAVEQDNEEGWWVGADAPPRPNGHRGVPRRAPLIARAAGTLPMSELAHQSPRTRPAALGAEDGHDPQGGGERAKRARGPKHGHDAPAALPRCTPLGTQCAAVLERARNPASACTFADPRLGRAERLAGPPFRERDRR